MGDRHSTAVNRKCWFNFPFESAISAILLPCASFVCIAVIKNWLRTSCVWSWQQASWRTLDSASRPSTRMAGNSLTMPRAIVLHMYIRDSIYAVTEP